MKRNKFSLSHYKLLTMDMGELIPLTWFEAIPGDTIQMATSALIRVSPLLSPVMHPVKVRIHHWFVPNRLVWDDWEEFITGGPDGLSVPTHPYKALSAPGEGTIYDYMGIKGTFAGSTNVNALPLRAYWLIWNEFYRDQDLSTALTIDKTDGADTSSFAIKNVCWEKDYFTTARPWEQKGAEVTIPLGDSAPITGIGKGNQNYNHAAQNVYETDGSGTTQYADAQMMGDSAADYYYYVEEDPNNSGYPNIRADLASATGININDLRLALALQRYQEARAQHGSRYVEYLKYLGVKSSDGRLQNPEYLGGGRQVIQFSEVLSTDGSNTGDLKGHGIAAMRTNRFRRFFEEHGIVMTLMSVIPKTIYSQQMNRAWLREVKEDYFQRELQHIGQQEITNKEVFLEHASPDDVFGYQNRYDEYRNIPSNISGEFHSTLDHWHYARIFGSDPALNGTFVTATPTKRVNASATTDCLYVMSNHSIQARRMLSKVGKGRLL